MKLKKETLKENGGMTFLNDREFINRLHMFLLIYSLPYQPLAQLIQHDDHRNLRIQFWLLNIMKKDVFLSKPNINNVKVTQARRYQILKEYCGTTKYNTA